MAHLVEKNHILLISFWINIYIFLHIAIPVFNCFMKPQMPFLVPKLHAVDLKDEGHRSLFRGLLMTACDLGAMTKPWPIQQKIASLVATEFFNQVNSKPNSLESVLKKKYRVSQKLRPFFLIIFHYLVIIIKYNLILWIQNSFIVRIPAAHIT